MTEETHEPDTKPRDFWRLVSNSAFAILLAIGGATWSSERNLSIVFYFLGTISIIITGWLQINKRDGPASAWLLAGLIVVDISCFGAVWQFTQDPPFLVEIKGALISEKPDLFSPYSFLAGFGTKNNRMFLKKIDVMVHVIITNRTSNSLGVRRYWIDLKGNHGSWQRLVKLQIEQEEKRFYRINENNQVSGVVVRNDLDSAAAAGPIPPSGTLSGWAFFCLPPSFHDLAHPNLARISVESRTGKIVTAETDMNAGADDIVPRTATVEFKHAEDQAGFDFHQCLGK